MLFNKRLLQLTAAALLLLFPALLFAAAFQIIGSSTRSAIDTLTVSDNGALLASAAGNTGLIIFKTDSLASATATRDRIIFEGTRQLDCRLFRIQPLGTDRAQLNATGGRTIVSLKLNGTELTSDSSKAGQIFTRNDAGENPPLSACGPATSLSFYGLIILALLLAGMAIWMFRKRKMGLA